MADADLTQREYDRVLDVLRSGRLTMGPQTEEFERISAAYCGATHGIAVSSGTAGLHMLCIAAGIQRDDEVITTPFSFVASTNCFLYLGARPIFVDIEPETYCINPDLIAQAVSKKTKAIIAVDVFGHPAQWERITKIAQDRGLIVIADACESLGATYGGKRTGPVGIGGVFAYFPNKQITTGEGGMIVTNDANVARLCRSLRNQGRDETGSWLGHTRLGYNYRIDELSAALGVAQMQRIDELLSKRMKVAGLYDRLLAGDNRVRRPQTRSNVNRSHFVYVIEVLVNVHRDAVILAMEKRGIPSRGYFSPVHHQPYMQEYCDVQALSLPVTERVATRTLALPFYSDLTEDQIEHVVNSLRKALDGLT